MGGSPWWYIEPYEADVEAALKALQEREFKAGRYSPVMLKWDMKFPITASSPAPGAEHDSIEDAVEASAEEGTASILDMSGVVTDPDDWGLRAFTPEQLRSFFGTEQPTLAQVEANIDGEGESLFTAIDRGEGYYCVIYENGQPSAYLFAGYSFD